MKKYITFLCATMLWLTVHAQSQQVLRGRVINAVDSTAIEGVSVQGKGIRATLTNRLGIFEISISERDIELTISHIGYQEQKINSKDFTDSDQTIIALSPLSHEIDQVMISTGYEEVPIERTTGSFSVIDRATLDREVGYEVISRLDHLATGVYFDRSDGNYNSVGLKSDQRNLSVHGISTLRSASSGANMPLIVLDNFPFEGDINDINPNDIENITILKDAAASSIWGSKAGNGVIVITTRKGKYGQPIRTSFSASVGLTEKPALFEQKLISISDVIDLEQFLFSQGYYTSQENNRAKPVISPVVEILIQQRDGDITSEEATRLIDSYRHLDVRNDLLKYSYRVSEHQQYAWTISGGANNYKFSTSLGYDKSLPSSVSNMHDRLTIRFDQGLALSRKVEFQAGINWNFNSDKQAPESYLFSQSSRFLYSMMADENGNPNPVPHQYRMSFLDTAGQGSLLDWHYRPLNEITKYTFRKTEQNLHLNTGLSYKILSNLSLDAKYRYSLLNSNTRDLRDIDSYYTRNRINRGTEISNDQIIYNFPLGDILEKSNRSGKSHFGRLQLNYNHSHSGNHQLRALVGIDIQHSLHQSLGGFTTFGHNDDILTFTPLIDYFYRYPVFGNLAAYEQVGYPVSGEEYLINRFISYYGNTSYAYKDKYIISGSARRDASNMFGVETNDRWTPLWSVGVSWIIDKERFMERVGSGISKLRLRASYGYSGNVDQSMSALPTIRYQNNSATTGVVQWPVAAVVNSPPNPLLRWEKVGNWNVGLDLGLGERFSATVDIYRKFTSDLLQNVNFDPTTGHSGMIMNVANTRGEGVDLNINGKILTGSIDWFSNLMVTYNNNYITRSHYKYSNPRTFVSLVGLNTMEGKMAFPAYSYRWAGLNPETGAPQGYLNGEISEDYRAIISNQTTLDDLVFHGSARPLYYGSFRNQFSYKSLSLSFNLTYRLGYFFRRDGMNYTQLISNQIGHEDYYLRWKRSGDENYTHVPSFSYPADVQATNFYLGSEVLIERGDHIRLQDVHISYLMDNSFVRKAQIRLYVSIHNLGIIWRANKLQLDPQMTGMVPHPKTFNIGLQLSL